MREKTAYFAALGISSVLTLLLLWVLFGRDMFGSRRPALAVTPAARSAAQGERSRAPDSRGELRRNPQALRLLAGLHDALNQQGARPGEAVLTFKTAAAYRDFLARARAAGLNVRGRLDALRTVRVGAESLAALQSDLLDHADDYGEISANYYVQIPTAPPKEDRAAANEVPFGNRALSFLGVTGDQSQWGRGVTIAVLDSGVATDATFAPGRVRYADLGLGIVPGNGADDGHGTAVAALAAGAARDAPGVAPAADILSIRITAADGMSDVFTLAQGIITAADTGAQVINISMGSYATTGMLDNAIDYALARGVMIVASAGNDQAAQLTWPAADPRVISVGAVDALGQQVSFSNSGEQLKMTAPGYGVQTAWLDGQRVSFDGTSASAPIVAGAIAAMMSQNPGMTAAQAWQVLAQYASDAGAPGADPAYGNGILNLGWAMNRNDPTRVDTAIASHYYDATTNQMGFVVQNRSGQTVSGLTLAVDAAGNAIQYAVPSLAPGATYVAKYAVDPAALQAAGQMIFRSQLVNPAGIVDVVPANNVKATILTAPVSPTK